MIWPLKWFKATFEAFIIVVFLGGRGEDNLLVKNTAFELIDKKTSSQNYSLMQNSLRKLKKV